jgi:hypothetical protein
MGERTMDEVSPQSETGPTEDAELCSKLAEIYKEHNEVELVLSFIPGGPAIGIEEKIGLL